MNNIEEDKTCAPTVLERESKYHSADFSCNNCNQTDCIYWILYNREHEFNHDVCIPPDNSKPLKLA